MRNQTRQLVAVVAALCSGLPVAGATATPRHHPRVRLPGDYAAWTHVATCESGGWRVLGAAYPNSLGITAVNYLHFGGRPQPTGPVTVAERVAQIRVADRLIRHYGISVPDQGGCHGSW